VLVGAAVISGVFALIFGGLFSYGGLPEASAAVVFGLWFLTCRCLLSGPSVATTSSMTVVG
jgi:hypothetical protein